MKDIERKVKDLYEHLDQLQEDLDYAYCDMNKDWAFDLHKEITRTNERIRMLCELQEKPKS